MNTGKNGHGMVLVLPQNTVVSLGVDPMMLELDLDIRLCSMLYLNLLKTWLGPCSRKISLDRHRSVFSSRVDTEHSLSCSKLSQLTDHRW